MGKLALLILVLACALAPQAQAARHDALPLHIGSSGPNVSRLQYLIRDPRPRQNVFHKVKGTYKGHSTGYFGKRTGLAVYAYKYRLGFPRTYNHKSHPVVGPFLFGLMRGTAHRPASWVALAAKRLAAVEPGATPWAIKARDYTLRLLKLNIVEYPVGSNRGLYISYGYPTFGLPALQSATGAYGVAWCVSTWQTILKHIGYGTFADDTAGVFYLVHWAAARNLLHAKPKFGALVAFMDGQGHLGFVMKVTASGFASAEGNASNRFLERFHNFGDRRPVYVYLPRIA